MTCAVPSARCRRLSLGRGAPSLVPTGEQYNNIYFFKDKNRWLQHTHTSMSIYNFPMWNSFCTHPILYTPLVCIPTAAAQNFIITVQYIPTSSSALQVSPVVFLLKLIFSKQLSFTQTTQQYNNYYYNTDITLIMLLLWLGFRWALHCLPNLIARRSFYVLLSDVKRVCFEFFSF